jgi:phage shock protein A
MALVTRLSRLFQADFHAVLDRIEEPDLQLRQAVREMQFTLDQDQQRLKLLQHEAAQLDKASRAASANLEGYDEGHCNSSSPAWNYSARILKNKSTKKISN